MNLFRNLLFWLVLALAGALVAQLLVQDPGQVVVSFRGMDYRFTVVAGLLMLAAVLLVLWLAWAVVRLPFRGWRGFRSRRERARLTDGIDAFMRVFERLPHERKPLPEPAAKALSPVGRG